VRLAEPPSFKAVNASPFELALLEIDSSWYGFEVQALRAVLPATVTTLPLAPRGVAGLMNVRGQLITVLNAASLVGAPNPVRSEVVILLETQTHGAIGLLVERPPTLFEADLTTLEPMPDGSSFVRGMIDGRIRWLELEAWLNQVQPGGKA
jgi:purine-binding chemotaxis protein CheW